MQSPPNTRQFDCQHCGSAIQIPFDLPATEAPCPHCGSITISPEPDFSPKPDEQGIFPPGAQAESIREEEEATSGSGLVRGVMTIALLGLLAGGFFLVQKNKEVGSTISSQHPAELSSDELGYEGVEKEALEVLAKFFSAPSAKEKAQYIIGGDELLTELEAYEQEAKLHGDVLRADYFSEVVLDLKDRERGLYLMEYYRPRQFEMSEYFAPITRFEVSVNTEEPDAFTKARAFRNNYEMEAERAWVFFKKVGDELLFDWSVYIQTKDRLLREFVSSPVPGRSGIFRVVIGEDGSTYYEDDSTSRIYRVMDAAHSKEDVALIKVTKATEVGQILEQLAWTDQAGKKAVGRGVTLELRWSKDAKPVLEIGRVICWEFIGLGGDPTNLDSGK